MHHQSVGKIGNENIFPFLASTEVYGEWFFINHPTTFTNDLNHKFIGLR